MSIRRSIAWSFLDKYSVLAIQFLTGVVLARLLTPESFGVFAIAFAIVGFAHRIREMGVASYLVRTPRLEPVHIRSALFATGVVAWSLALLLLLALPLIQQWFGTDVRRASAVLLLNFLVMPISSTIVPILQREMNFSALLVVNLTGIVANSACGIGLALAGAGYLALAWASVAGQVGAMLAAAAMRPHRDHFLPSYAAARSVFRFGSPVMLSSLLQQFTTNAANLIVSRFVTIEAIGFLSRAQSITGLYARLVMQAIEPLVLPILSQKHRRGEDLQPACLQGFSFLMVIVWPFFGFLLLYAQPVVLVLLGRQWTEAIPLLRLLAIAEFFVIVQPLAEPVLIAVGRVDLVLNAQIVNQSVAVLGVLLAAMHGIAAVAGAWIALCAIQQLTWLVCLRRVVPVSQGGLRRLALRGALITAASLALPFFCLRAGAQLDPILRLMIGGSGLAAGWLAGVFAFRHPLADEVRLLVRNVALAAR